ncbi:MAG: type II toxin-antitoxin system prevent-host-death family antitoxin [Deltaproteobacteria bacterium]|nr:type II toxin-antitoxin system prevent-host-death family antitoxin [Deltaproteobacteria bacterium]
MALVITNRGGLNMKTATVGEIQKNFARVLKNIWAGQEITVTRRGKPVAKIAASGPRDEIE